MLFAREEHCVASVLLWSRYTQFDMLNFGCNNNNASQMMLSLKCDLKLVEIATKSSEFCILASQINFVFEGWSGMCWLLRVVSFA